ncbi:hypothetical protein FGO68_gene314 [Halteria grandinella]|uniref:Uncharacterized protein n=1 Tax=Halteria grandinella TaxID=5974 RepID=A0A8J8P430_HALGN|nr:hypothetical protein FGO68_gene314 [Halteria grandinella]
MLPNLFIINQSSMPCDSQILWQQIWLRLHVSNIFTIKDQQTSRKVIQYQIRDERLANEYDLIESELKRIQTKMRETLLGE